MQILFIDESGTPLSPDKADDSPPLVLGGIIIPNQDWHSVKADLEEIKEKYGVSGEIKWRFFFVPPGKKSTDTLSALDEQARESLRSELYAVLNKYQFIKAISVIVHAKEAYAIPDINNTDDLYCYAYKVMAERFQYYLKDISSNTDEPINGLIVCDHRARSEDSRLQELHATLLKGNHKADSNYTNIVEGVFVAPSHLSVGIQFADMVAGAILRLNKKDTRFYSQIEKIFRKSETDPAEGHSLIELPEKKNDAVSRLLLNPQKDAVTAHK